MKKLTAVDIWNLREAGLSVPELECLNRMDDPDLVLACRQWIGYRQLLDLADQHLKALAVAAGWEHIEEDNSDV